MWPCQEPVLKVWELGEGWENRVDICPERSGVPMVLQGGLELRWWWWSTAVGVSPARFALCLHLSQHGLRAHESRVQCRLL